MGEDDRSVDASVQNPLPWSFSKTTARRYLQGPRIPTPRAPETPKRAVKARHPDYTWHLDLTQIPAFLRAATLHFAVMFDSFSRMPVTFQLFEKAATAAQMATFFDRTVALFGKPKYLIVDRGGEFTGDNFRDMTRAHRLKARYASADNHRANSRIERFWRSLKALICPVPPPATVELLFGDRRFPHLGRAA